MPTSPSETEETGKSEVKHRNERLSFASGSTQNKGKSIKRSPNLLAAPKEELAAVQSKPNDTTISTITIQDPTYEIVIVEEDIRGSVTEPELGSWPVRRARAKSVYLSCIAGVDSIYFIVRLVIFLRVSIFHDTYELDPSKSKNSVSYYCNDADLEIQCAWIFSVNWLCYILAIILLILSIIWLSLQLCYWYIFMKTTSIIIHFLGLLTYGYHCLSQNFYVETGVFFILHLPLQIFGAKMAKEYAVSLKRAAMEKAMLRLITENASEAPTISSGSIAHARNKQEKSFQRRKSHQVVTTVDG